jgi:hypothetical protein
VRERTSELHRIAQVLEGANPKLASVASIGGASSRAILAALMAGETDAAAMAELARGRLREQRAARRPPKQAQLVALESIAGNGRRLAEVVIAEVGADMTRFPSARHRASSGRPEPGPRRGSRQAPLGRTRKGSPWLRGALVEAAHAAARTPTALGRRCTASPRHGAPNAPRSPSATPSSSSPTSDSPIRPSASATSAPTTPTSATVHTSPAGSCAASTPSATRSSSHPPAHVPLCTRHTT